MKDTVVATWHSLNKKLHLLMLLSLSNNKYLALPLLYWWHGGKQFLQFIEMILIQTNFKLSMFMVMLWTSVFKTFSCGEILKFLIENHIHQHMYFTSQSFLLVLNIYFFAAGHAVIGTSFRYFVYCYRKSVYECLRFNSVP